MVLITKEERLRRQHANNYLDSNTVNQPQEGIRPRGEVSARNTPMYGTSLRPGSREPEHLESNIGTVGQGGGVGKRRTLWGIPGSYIVSESSRIYDTDTGTWY